MEIRLRIQPVIPQRDRLAADAAGRRLTAERCRPLELGLQSHAGPEMLPLKRLGILLLVVMFFLLPLYELADIGEHWPHDGDVVLVLFCLLFVAAISLICRGIACACLASLKRICQFGPQRRSVRVHSFVVTRADSPLFLIFCDLRV